MDVTHPSLLAERGRAQPIPFVSCDGTLWFNTWGKKGSLKLYRPEIEKAQRVPLNRRATCISLVSLTKFNELSL